MTETKRFDPRFQEQMHASSTLREQVYQAIHDSIICGRILPGEPLPQEELATELGVSARTVREALSRLVAEGVAEHEPHHSVRVTSFTVDDQEELYRMRAVIEGMAFEEAAAHITQPDLDHLREILLLASQTNDPQSAETARHYNQEFHWIIIRASQKRQFIRVLAQIWRSMFTYFVGYELIEDHLYGRDQDVATHTAILEALGARDGKRARGLLEEHIQFTFEAQRRQMKEFLETSPGRESEINISPAIAIGKT
jgi:DNA-binding GntR family transcriptional regulator